MKKVNRIALGLIILALAYSLMVLLPKYLGGFQSLLGDKFASAITVKNEAQRIEDSVNVFYQLYWIMMLAICAINALFLILEETIPVWYKGSYMRFFLQLALNFICFTVFFIVILQYMPAFFIANKMRMLDGATTTMMICMLAGFLVMAFAGLYGASPTNRDGMPGITVWLRRRKVK